MEGVGARFGRSSTRYGGPTTVFTGPVRRWKKKWVHVPPSNSNHNNHTAANGTVNGANGSSHLLLYKWTAMVSSQNKDSSQNDNNSSNDGNADPKNSSKEDGVAAEEPPRRKFKYIPIIVLEEQKNESEQMDDETKPVDSSVNTGEATSKSDGYDEKPDINDVPMDENEAAENNNTVQRQDLNESTLDLSLGLNGHDGENESADQTKADHSE